MTLFAVAGDPDAPTLVPLECVIGANWVLTAHQEHVPVLDEFLKRAEGGGQVGELDSPSFVAAITSGSSPATCALSKRSKRNSRN